MTYFNEGANSVVIDGIEIYSADDLEGAPVGLFLSKAQALAAQRALNVKKMLLMTTRDTDARVDSCSCEFEFQDGIIETWHTSFDGSDWLEPEDDLANNLNTSFAPPTI